MSLFDFEFERGGEGRLWQFVQEQLAEWRKGESKGIDSLSIEELRDLIQILEKKITERTGMLRVLYDVSQTAAEAETIDEALVKILVRIAKHNGWCGGFIYLPSRINPSVLLPAKAFYEDPPDRFLPLRRTLKGKRFSPGEGLPGRVYETGLPEWISDINGAFQDHRRDIILELGMRTVAGFPILEEESVSGVFEFFSDKLIERDQHVVDSMTSVGVHVGLFMERHRMHRLVNDLANRERVRIGQQLHDHLGQTLTGASLVSKSLERQLRDGNDLRHDAVQELNDILRQAQNQMKQIARGLLLTDLQSEGLFAALKTMIRDEYQQFPVDLHLEIQEDLEISDKDVAEQWYHITREAISNACKYAGAANITIRIYSDEASAHLEIEDNGIGFPRKSKRKPGLGVGIMRHRARAVGGRLRILNRQDGGAIIRCTIDNNALAEKDRG
jgi:signal transduction histidine kinase